jgi:myosin regulatory light chain 12
MVTESNFLKFLEDLHDIYASLGKENPDEIIEKMLNEAQGPINFTMFLTLFGVKLNGTDPDDALRNAFMCFDEKNTGFISEEIFRESLTTMGDRYTEQEVSIFIIIIFRKNLNAI